MGFLHYNTDLLHVLKNTVLQSTIYLFKGQVLKKMDGW